MPFDDNAGPFRSGPWHCHVDASEDGCSACAGSSPMHLVAPVCRAYRLVATIFFIRDGSGLLRGSCNRLRLLPSLFSLLTRGTRCMVLRPGHLSSLQAIDEGGKRCRTPLQQLFQLFPWFKRWLLFLLLCRCRCTRLVERCTARSVDALTFQCRHHRALTAVGVVCVIKRKTLVRRVDVCISVGRLLSPWQRWWRCRSYSNCCNFCSCSRSQGKWRRQSWTSACTAVSQMA